MKFDFKKILVAIAAAVVSFFFMAFVLKALLSVNALVAALSIGIGYGVYRLLELWEQKKAAKLAPPVS
jgi:predicted RND superfamily exporter protein